MNEAKNAKTKWNFAKISHFARIFSRTFFSRNVRLVFSKFCLVLKIPYLFAKFSQFLFAKFLHYFFAKHFEANFRMYKVYLTPLNILKKPPPIPSLLDLILNPGKISLNPKGEGGVSITIYCSKLQSKAARGAWKTKWKKLNIENLWGQSQIFSINTPPPSPTTFYIFIHMVITKGRYKKRILQVLLQKRTSLK